MKKQQIKQKMFTIVLTLMLTLTTIIVLIPGAYAQESKATYAFIGAVPNPVGVNQDVLLHLGIPDPRSSSELGWEGLTVTITTPTGDVETLGPFKTDSTGGTGTLYNPTMVGTYLIQTNFPEQTVMVQPFFSPVATEVTYLASTSPVLQLEVQEEPIEYYPASNLPDEYWTRPIDAQLREWYSVSGSWLVATPILPTDNLFVPYNDGPETAHILWTMPVGDTMGGLAGGPIGEHSYGIGDAYEGKWVGSVIISGVLFYNKFESGQPQQEVVAVDLHTGEELWTKTFFDNKRISFGQVLYWDCLNYHGAFSYLWVVDGSNWYAFEPLSGEWRYNMTNVPSGTNYYGPSGEILKYSVNLQNGWMTQWNTSTVVSEGKTGTSQSWGSQVKGRTYDASVTGIDWNASIPVGLPGSVLEVEPMDRVIGGSISATEINLWGISLVPGNEGELLFQNTWQAPASWSEGNQTISWAAANLDEYVTVVYSKEMNNYYAFSLETGEYMWGPTEPENYLNIYDRISTINYGVLLSSGASGIVYGYNITDGQLIWSYNAEDPYSEILWANNWWVQQMFITDGKLYLGHVEHSPINPLPRGAPFICLDVLTGDEVWRIDGGFRQTCWGGKAMIADSIITLMNTYDQSIYAIGKGPTAITTEAPLVGVEKGKSVTIRGTITDVSPGASSYALSSRFPNGVPAIADEYMSEWMKYVYMQFDRPVDAVGVPVKIQIVDPNGEYSWIGTATSDSYGTYGYSFIPQVSGVYTIIVTFDGSKAYYGSTSITYMSVDSAPESVNLSPIESSVNDVKGSVTQLDSSVDELGSCVSDLEGSVNDLGNLKGSVDNLQGSTSGFEASISNLESSIANQTTFIMAILAFVIIAIAIAVYSAIKTRK